MPDDPNRPGEVAWSVMRSQERAHNGSWSARFFLDGRQDDGTVWLERELPPAPGATVGMTVWYWSASESFNTLAHAVAYLGPDDPEREGDFPAPGQDPMQDGAGFGGFREPLDQAAGWRPYSFSWQVPENATGALHAAFGISAVWETEMVYFADDVHVGSGEGFTQ